MQNEATVIAAVQVSGCKGEDLINCEDGLEIANSFGIQPKFGAHR